MNFRNKIIIFLSNNLLLPSFATNIDISATKLLKNLKNYITLLVQILIIQNNTTAIK